MGLSSILNIAGSGLNITQAGLDIVARNVANADTPGYTKKTVGQENFGSGQNSFGVREISVTRTIDQFLQARFWEETAALSDVEVRRDFMERIDQLFGQPGSPTALDTIYNEFTSSLQDLTSTPELYSTRQQVVSNAQTLAQQLQQLSGEVQSLRQSAEDSLAQAVADVNEALTQLSKINQTLGVEASRGAPSADLLDQRDKFINQIAEFLDIRVNEAADGTVSIFTQSGNALLAGLPVQLQFDQRGDINATSLYSAVDADRGVGTLKITASNGFEIDLIRNGILDSGRIGALIELRDNTLVEVQAQLDELTHGLALSLSTKTVSGTAATAGTQLGFDVDTAGLQAGNTISLNYTTTPPGTTQQVTIVRVDDPSILPLANDATANANDIVIGVDFSGGPAAVAATLNTALDAAGVLGNGITVSAPGGTVLRFLDDTGVGDTTVINAASAAVTSTAVQDDGIQIPLFVDGGKSPPDYTGALGFGGQKLGFSGRISVNTLVTQNNEVLVRHSTAPQTPLGDTTRPFELLDRLTGQAFTFDPASGIGQTQNPFTSDIGSFLERVVSVQTGRAEEVNREFASKDLVATSLRERLTSQSAVDINTELSDLIELQNSFAANARIIQAVDELIDVLFRAF